MNQIRAEFAFLATIARVIPSQTVAGRNKAGRERHCRSPGNDSPVREFSDLRRSALHPVRYLQIALPRLLVEKFTTQP